MIIPKAIELLQLSIDEETYFCDQDLENAVKLGIEALKRFQNCRLHPGLQFYCPLPGETRENEK